MNCEWCTIPHKGQRVALIDPPEAVVLCRDCRKLAAGEGRL